jgi:uncharacterized protein (DUF1501 family)
MLSRRQFLQTSSLVSLSPVLPCILGSTARAAAAAPDARVLVVVQLDGGNDGINTVVPFGDDGYGRARKKLRLETEKLHRLDGHVGLHPNMRAAKELYDDGRLAIVQGVGYPNPDRSHFRSMRIWHTARFDDAKHDGYGWLGRALDHELPQAKGGRNANAIFVGEQETPVALWGRRATATALSRAKDLKLQGDVTCEPAAFDLESGRGALHHFVTRQVLSAYAAADEFARQELDDVAADGGGYPNTQLGSRLELVAKLLRSGSQTRIFYTVQGGYDTHSAQLYTHSQLLREFSDAVKSFLDDLKSAKLDDRVVLLAFSEFGRRVQENDSQGTDHGTAGPVFLAGSSVSGGLVGKAPDLTDPESGDVKIGIDFRSVYATILDQWLGVSAKEVMGGTFASLSLFTA